MASQESANQRKISLLAHQPWHIVNGVIRITDEAKPPSIQRTSLSSSFGNLDILPLEVLHSTFAMLDFKTLSRISRTCLYGAAVVKSLPEYRDLMQHAPRTLAALGKTRLAYLHSAATIRAALCSAECVSCGYFGPFLILLKCQRCCFYCLWRNQSLWVIPISVAEKAFGLSAAGAKTLPSMLSVPGDYWVRCTVSRQRRIRLVCVWDAKKAAIAEGRSEAHMKQDLEVRKSNGLSDKKYCFLRYLQRAPLARPGPDIHASPSPSNSSNDFYCGMGVVLFPFLAAPNCVEQSLWCLGCKLVADKFDNMPYIARSKAEFLRHIDQCPGAKQLADAADKRQRTMTASPSSLIHNDHASVHAIRK